MGKVLIFRDKQTNRTFPLYIDYKHYTTTSYVRWEKCNVPLCEDNVAEDPTTTTAATTALPVQNDAVSTNEPGLRTMTF